MPSPVSFPEKFLIYLATTFSREKAVGIFFPSSFFYLGPPLDSTAFIQTPLARRAAAESVRGPRYDLDFVALEMLCPLWRSFPRNLWPLRPEKNNNWPYERWCRVSLPLSFLIFALPERSFGAPIAGSPSIYFFDYAVLSLGVQITRPVPRLS